MSKFTKKQINKLLKNKYVVAMKKDHIVFSEAFKIKVLTESLKGKTYRQIFGESGFTEKEVSQSAIRFNCWSWKQDFEITITKDGTYFAKRIKGAYPILLTNGGISFTTIKGGSKVNTYSKKDVEKFKANKYVNYVDSKKIDFTAEFKQKFIEEYKQGKSTYEIFSENGLSPDIIGKQKVKTCARRWKDQSVYNPTFRKDKSYIIPSSEKRTERLKVQQLERKLKRLEIENEFLKKVQTLRKE